jgi:hypothetical protein
MAMNILNNNNSSNTILRSDNEKYYWKYFTNVNPLEIKQDTHMIRALDLFIDELCLDINVIKGDIEKYNKYIIHIYTDGPLDIIKMDHYHPFLKSKFIFNKKLKQKIIEYYNAHDLFIKGPIQISEFHYIIILSKLRIKDY